jgi:dolichyl-phosphate beta-glucosyltransferase
MWGFHLLVWVLCVSNIKDTQCGFKLFTRKSAHLLFTNLHLERWAFDVELLFLAQQQHIPVCEIPVNWTEVPGSKLDPLRASIEMGRDLFKIRLAYMTGIWRFQPFDKIKSTCL